MMIRIRTPPTTTNGVMRNRRNAAFLAAEKGVLYHAEITAYAHSRVSSKLRPGIKRHRLFVDGEMWQSVNRTMGRIVWPNSFGLFRITEGWIDRYCYVSTEIAGAPSVDEASELRRSLSSPPSSVREVGGIRRSQTPLSGIDGRARIDGIHP